VGPRSIAIALLTACYAPHARDGAPCVDSPVCPAGQTCIAGWCRLPDYELDSDAAIDPPGLPASCLDIQRTNPSAPSGLYAIYPDSAGTEPALEVTCDMATLGGGWTIVFFPSTLNLDELPPAYTSSTPRLLAAASEALIAYRDDNQIALPGFATFAMQTSWRTHSPFDDPGTDVTLAVTIDGEAPVVGTLRFGTRDFSAMCTDPWWASGNYGRLCIDGTMAPFYSGFSTPAADLCSTSDLAYDVTACVTQRRFSIAVR